MEKKQIGFTEAEASAAVQLIDIAVKQGGLNVAEAGLVLSKKFQEAFKKEEKVEKVEKK